MRQLKAWIAAVLLWGSLGLAGAAEAMPGEFKAFLAAFPPGSDVKPLREELPPLLRKHAHPTLVAFWRQVGTGSFGQGFLVFFHPREYEQMLARWLLRDTPDPTRIPFARTAFGDLVYFRDLRERAKAQGLPSDWKEASDVAFLSIHHRANAVITWSMDDFFASDMQAFLRKDARAYHALYPALAAAQPLRRAGECYYFVPALVLGGRASADQVKQGDCGVHQELLLQMALTKKRN